MSAYDLSEIEPDKQRLGGLTLSPRDGRPMPLLLFLHGRGEAGTNIEDGPQGLDALRNHESPISSHVARRYFVVTAPQAPKYDRDDVWREQMGALIEYVGRVQYMLGSGRDRALYVSGFSQGAYAAARYVAQNSGSVQAWVGADAAGGNKPDPATLRLAYSRPHLLLAGPHGFGCSDEIRNARLTHPQVCREAFSGRWRPGNVNVYEWLINH